MTRLCALLVPMAIVAAARPASAQAQAQTRLAQSVTEENEPVQLDFRVTLERGGRASNARLPTAPAGVTVGPPRIASGPQIVFRNGQLLQSYTITVSWSVAAAKPGKYRLGPPSIEIDGNRVVGQTQQLEVVAAGSLSRRPRGIPGRPPSDPFDLFDAFRNFPNFPDFPFPFPEEERQDLPTYPPELAQERALDPIAFVVAKASPTRVVVGQPVRFQLYAYGGRGGYEIESANEPSRAGFIAYPDTAKPVPYNVPIGGQNFIALNCMSLVLFPVESGTLRIGPARLGFSGRNYRPTPPATLLNRESAPIDIVVSEPPLKNRPPGYRIGDVGRYKLSATVDPQKVRQGESVSVVAKLEGVGNVPAKLDVPLQSGVDWQAPTTSENIEVNDGVVGGQRTFNYVVRLERDGLIDLGELKLPFYDPEERRYSIATASLGKVEVTPNPAAAKAPGARPDADDPLKGVVPPQRTLESVPPPGTPLTDQRLFWALLALGPLGVITANGLLRASKRLRKSLKERRHTPRELASREVTNARTAAGAGDEAAAIAAVERAVHLAIEAALGLKSRGVLRSELSETLVARGFAVERAKEATELLEAAEHARFVRSGNDRESSELVARADVFVRAALSGRRA